jgi:hypothetical protein
MVSLRWWMYNGCAASDAPTADQGFQTMNAMLLTALLVLSVLQFIGLLLLWRRLSTTVAAPVAAPPAPVYRAELPVELIVASMQRLDGRMAQIEQQVRAGQPAGEPGVDRSYALAQRLARQGASAQEIADTCGLFISEAELLIRLNGGPSA